MNISKLFIWVVMSNAPKKTSVYDGAIVKVSKRKIKLVEKD